MKKIIYIFGTIFLSIVLVLNLIFTAELDAGEHIEYKINNLIYISGIIITTILILYFTKKINNKLYDEQKDKSKIRKKIFAISICIYFVFNVIWVILVNPGIGADQIHVGNIAQAIFRGNLKEIFPSLTYAGIPLKSYIESYPQQLTLAFVYSIFFRIMNSDVLQLLRIVNVIADISIIFAIYKITNQISKKYETNKVLLMTLILTFVSIPMLSTFIYGDIPSLALSLFSVYFMMKYKETKLKKYVIIASFFTMIAYLMRMNSLIFIIATVMYLVIDFYSEFKKENKKSNCWKTLMIIIYLAISIIPSTLVKNYYFSKYDLDESRKYPTISFLLLAMEESHRANGWYSENIRRTSFKRTTKNERRV